MSTDVGNFDIGFGVQPNDPHAIKFYLSLLAAMALVYFIGRKKFDQFSGDENDDDYASKLLPKYLAMPQEYRRGRLIYVGTVVFAIFLLSLVVTQNFLQEVMKEWGAFTSFGVPASMALLFIGIVPNVPVLQDIEKWLRQFAHNRAFIPAAARALAEKLLAAEFGFPTFHTKGVLVSAEMRGVDRADFDASRQSLEHSWARLSCLSYQLDERRLSGNLGVLDGEFMRRYAKHLDGIGKERKAMERDIAAYRREKSKNPDYTDYALHRRIQDLLYRLYVLLGCAVRLKAKTHNEIDLALRPFGFKLEDTAALTNNRSLNFFGILVMAVCVFALGLGAIAISHLWEISYLKLWQISPFFPRAWYQPFFDTASSTIANGAAIVATDLLRSQCLKQGNWFRTADGRRRALRGNYWRVAVMSFAAGYTASVLWGLVFAPPSLDALALAVPLALVPATSGVFYAYHLDNVDLHERPSRLWEIWPQAAVSAACGLVGGCALFVILLGTVTQALDEILFMVVMGAAVGGSLAWYIPAIAVPDRLDPLAVVRDERVRMLETAALERFGDPTKATEWLGQPRGTLGDKSPKAAAAQVEGFVHAIGLLQGPHETMA